MIHQHTKFGTKDFSSSDNVEQRQSFFEDMNPHCECDLHLEDSNPNFLHHTQTHDDALSYQTGCKSFSSSQHVQTKPGWPRCFQHTPLPPSFNFIMRGIKINRSLPWCLTGQVTDQLGMKAVLSQCQGVVVVQTVKLGLRQNCENKAYRKTRPATHNQAPEEEDVWHWPLHDRLSCGSQNRTTKCTWLWLRTRNSLSILYSKVKVVGLFFTANSFQLHLNLFKNKTMLAWTIQTCFLSSMLEKTKDKLQKHTHHSHWPKRSALLRSRRWVRALGNPHPARQP